MQQWLQAMDTWGHESVNKSLSATTVYNVGKTPIHYKLEEGLAERRKGHNSKEVNLLIFFVLAIVLGMSRYLMAQLMHCYFTLVC